jgi:GTPase SAR1 family protein
MVSLFSKKDYLQAFSEDDFRDQVLRPLFLRKGLQDGRDLCGPLEKGKDCIFVYTDPLGDQIIYAIQTKATNLSLASDPNKNLLQAEVQIRMMLETDVLLLSSKQKKRPTKVFLCTSGKINEPAKQHIFDNIKSPNIEFRDVDDLIPEIDKFMPEFWLGVAANKSPYLSSLHSSLNQLEMLGSTEINWCPIDEDTFIQLKVNRIKLERRSVRGRYFLQEVSVPKYQEFPVTDVANFKEARILLVADAGMGKTTSLRRLASSIAERGIQDIGNAMIPVLVKASTLSQSQDKLVDYLSNHTAEISSVSQPAFDLSDLEAGRLAILIDGLDEVSAQNARQFLVNELVNFSALYPKCKVILTSRNYLWLGDLESIEKFERFRISPIGWEQTTQLVKRLQSGQGLGEEETLEFLRRLEQVHGFDLNPLVVTLFLATVEADRTDIPANITELFKKFTEVMLGRWDESKGFAQLHQAPLKDFLLKQVAVAMHKEKRTSVPLHELRRVLTEELRKRRVESNTDVDQLVEEVVHRSGLFRVLGDEVEFKHLMIQEFFAGRGLAAGEIAHLIDDPWWQRCIVFHFGENPGDFTTFEQVAKLLALKSGKERSQAALTLGLSLQACYLMTLDEKMIMYSDVIEAMGKSSYEMFGNNTEGADMQIMRFVTEYVLGRDSVACDILRVEDDGLENLVLSQSFQGSEYTHFWYIAGLIEVGMLDKAYKYIRKYDPEDRRTLISFSFGSYLYERVKVTSKPSKRAAREIRNYLEPKVAPLRDAIMKEVVSELIELRNGEVKVLPDATKPDDV